MTFGSRGFITHPFVGGYRSTPTMLFYSAGKEQASYATLLFSVKAIGKVQLFQGVDDYMVSQKHL